MLLQNQNSLSSKEQGVRQYYIYNEISVSCLFVRESPWKSGHEGLKQLCD